ncbi:hypothetical protein REPUB_Repub01dG0224400 [Reevesia pubescens]
MRILSRNCRGLSSDLKKGLVKRKLREVKVDMLLLQESKMDSFEFRDIARCWGSDNFDWVYSLAIVNSGGLISIWDENVFNISVVLSGRNFILVVGKWIFHEFESVMVNVYAPCDGVEKHVCGESC